MLLDLLMETKENWDGALLIPTLDEYVIFVSQNRPELKKRYVCGVQDWEVIGRIINKDKLYHQAQKIDVPTPRVFFPDSLQSIAERRDDISYPSILKPYETHIFDRVYGKKNFLVRDYQELVEKFIECEKNDLKVMLSEIIPGDDSAICTYRSYIDSKGNLLAEMCTQKLRQYPAMFGQGSVQATRPMNQEIRHLALSLLRSLSYQGFSSTEFKRDHRDGRYKLMEINTRPGTVEWLLVSAGINSSYITYLDLVENTRIPARGYNEELYWINSHWEIVNFIELLKSGNRNLRSFVEPYWKKKVFAVPFRDDPMHYLIDTYFTGMKVLKKAKKRLQYGRSKRRN